MINLLPYQIKKQMRAARTNVVLIRYIVIMAIAIGFLVTTSSATYLFQTMMKASNEDQLAHIKKTPVPISSSQGQVNAFISNLATTKVILNNQITYSDVVMGLGALLPQGTIIDSLALTDSSFGSIMNLKIRATSADLEPQIMASFNSSSMFTGYKMLSTNQEAGNPNYPIAFDINVTLNRTATR